MRKALFLFVAFVFAFNALILSAQASGCMRGQEQQNAIEKMQMPACHEIQKTVTPQSPYTKHCNGICFCQHMMLSGHIAAVFSTVVEPVFFVSAVSFSSYKQHVFVLKTAPPHRPPITIS